MGLVMTGNPIQMVQDKNMAGSSFYSQMSIGNQAYGSGGFNPHMMMGANG